MTEDPSSGLGNDAGSAWVNLQDEARRPMPPPTDLFEKREDQRFAASSAAGKGMQGFWMQALGFFLRQVGEISDEEISWALRNGLEEIS